MKKINVFRLNMKKAILLGKRYLKGELAEEEKDELIELLLDILIGVRHFNRKDLIQVEKSLLMHKKDFDRIESMRKESQQ